MDAIDEHTKHQAIAMIEKALEQFAYTQALIEDSKSGEVREVYPYFREEYAGGLFEELVKLLAPCFAKLSDEQGL